MVGLAIGILTIIVFTGHPPPPARPTAGIAVSPTAAPSPERLREYQDRLRLLEDRARQQAAATLDPSLAARPLPDERAASATSPDPLAEDRKRREYESLFSSNVVMSRRPEGQRLTTVPITTSSALRVDGTDIASAPPSIDDVADAVVRATTRTAAAQPFDSKSVRQTDAASPVTTPPVSPAAHTRPVSTGPITVSARQWCESASQL